MLTALHIDWPLSPAAAGSPLVGPPIRVLSSFGSQHASDTYIINLLTLWQHQRKGSGVAGSAGRGTGGAGGAAHATSAPLQPVESAVSVLYGCEKHFMELERRCVLTLFDIVEIAFN